MQKTKNNNTALAIAGLKIALPPKHFSIFNFVGT